VLRLFFSNSATKKYQTQLIHNIPSQILPKQVIPGIQTHLKDYKWWGIKETKPKQLLITSTTLSKAKY